MKETNDEFPPTCGHGHSICSSCDSDRFQQELREVERLNLLTKKMDKLVAAMDAQISPRKSEHDGYAHGWIAAMNHIRAALEERGEGVEK